MVAILVARVCLSKANKKNEKALIQIPNEVVQISVTPNLQVIGKAINTNIFGVNIGFALARELDKDSGFVQLLRAMHPNSLRFPGGTVANYYHPNLPVYGYKRSEIPPGLGVLYNVQSKRKENILYNFIRLSKAVGSGAVFCANLLTGTTEETLFVLDELHKNNIPVLGVELGNEFCLLPYREKEFKSGDIYIQKVEATAKAIRAKYPNLKIAVIGGVLVPQSDQSKRAQFMRNWNEALSKVNFYDAYVWHFYANCATCDNDTYFDNVFLKSLQEMAPFKTNLLNQIMNDYEAFYGTNRKLWLTEWNVGNTTYLENTFTQAAYVYECFLKIIDINTQHNNYIELSSLHAQAELINPYKGKLKPVLSIDGENATTQYFAFKFLANTLTKDVLVADENIKCNQENVRNNFVCRTFYNPTSKQVFLHYINRSGNKIALELNANVYSNLHINAIDAEVPYASAGKTIYEKNYPNKVTSVRLREENLTSNKIQLAPFSFGCISYSY
ncbi:MAG: hypothetical protein KDD21_02280 [Bacteroidetes bacterium]|nr:hypothetical protein [Bacteroidota bacterium]